jgi:hypothetical protein
MKEPFGIPREGAAVPRPQTRSASAYVTLPSLASWAEVGGARPQAGARRRRGNI